ncbi:sigma 54-interacting transcriptional regulator, partial [Rhizobium ruizarguesonis]
SAEFQAKLLRVLLEGELERVGGTITLKVNVRLVCATNKDIETAVAAGEFRADLYYRINVVPITLPPLRQRDGDIPRLAQKFLQ